MLIDCAIAFAYCRWSANMSNFQQVPDFKIFRPLPLPSKVTASDTILQPRHCDQDCIASQEVRTVAFNALVLLGHLDLKSGLNSFIFSRGTRKTLDCNSRRTSCWKANQSSIPTVSQHKHIAFRLYGLVCPLYSFRPTRICFHQEWSSVIICLE